MTTYLLMVSLGACSLLGSQVATQEVPCDPLAEVSLEVSCVDCVNATDEFGGTALYQACFDVDEALVAMLLEAGADPMIFPSNGTVTPLYVAVQKQACGIVRKLLLAGADPRVRGDLDSACDFPDDIKKEFNP